MKNQLDRLVNKIRKAMDRLVEISSVEFFEDDNISYDDVTYGFSDYSFLLA